VRIFDGDAGARAGQPYVWRKRKMLPKSGTKIRELRRWYSVKGTCASRIVTIPTPNGRVMKYHSPKAVHRS